MSKREVFFWSDDVHDGRPIPSEHVLPRITRENREKLAKILSAGEVRVRFRGMANCRICGVELGSATLGGHGFVWPQLAEHYVIAHNVWPPGADDLLSAATAETKTWRATSDYSPAEQRLFRHFGLDDRVWTTLSPPQVYQILVVSAFENSLAGTHVEALRRASIALRDGSLRRGTTGWDHLIDF